MLGFSSFIPAYGPEAHWLLANPVRCSTPLIDQCVHAALNAGAYGAKLTGSGHGGCLFARLPPDRVGAVTEALRCLPVGCVVLDSTGICGVESM